MSRSRSRLNSTPSFAVPPSLVKLLVLVDREVTVGEGILAVEFRAEGPQGLDHLAAEGRAVVEAGGMRSKPSALNTRSKAPSASVTLPSAAGASPGP
jgi:hypothetical protein